MTALQSRRLVAIAAALLAALIVLLIVQDQRHGWPFSRHHVAPTAASLDSRGRPPSAMEQSASARAPIELPTEQIERLGVQFEPVEVRSLANPVRAVATVVAEESKITHVHTRVAGWLEELYVNTTGERVRPGQPLAAVFSQELVSSQAEYLAARRAAREAPSSAVVEAARQRLKVLGMNEAEIAAIEKSGTPRRLITISAPRDGIVLNRGVSAGTAIDPSTTIVTLADLSEVWVIAEVAEADAANVRVGSAATLSFLMSGRQSFTAPVTFISPTLTERTRTVRVRIPAANKDGALRPGMYGAAEFPPTPRQAITVARDAVIDTGESMHVFVHTGQNTIEPRQVRTGVRFADRIEVVEGLKPGDHVVTTGVFLIDSESRLRATGTTGHASHGGAQQRDDKQPDDKPAQHAH